MNGSKITLDNIEQFSVSLLEHHLRWMFKSTKDNRIPQAVEDQIIPLDPEAVQFLSDFINKQNSLTQELLFGEKLNRKETTFTAKERTKGEIKNWLTERNIPLDRKVFWMNQLDVAFVITWKMVIKFSDVLFFGTNETLWDSTMNWTLTFEPDEVFRFTDNLMLNAAEKVIETHAIDEILDKSLQTKVMEKLFSQPVIVENTEEVGQPVVVYKSTKELLQRNPA